jgi:hypothetical protein
LRIGEEAAAAIGRSGFFCLISITLRARKDASKFRAARRGIVYNTNHLHTKETSRTPFQHLISSTQLQLP